MSLRIAVVGPTNSGKTVYLAALLRGAYARGRIAKPIKVRAEPTNAAGVALERVAASVICGGAAPATESVTQLELLADLPGSLFFGIGKETLQISMIDVPGGDCMPPVNSSVPLAVQQSVANADALMVVIPAELSCRPPDVCQRLRSLVDSAISTRATAPDRFPFVRVAVVMSMAEVLVADRGDDAFAALESMDAQQQLTELCGPEIVSLVRQLAPPGGDWFAFVSAFGFQQTGAIAATHTSAGWRITTPDEGFNDNWRPYRVFEPIEFLGRGVCWRGDA